MLIFDVLKKFENKKIRLYVDMDGCIADYEVGAPNNYDKKRPLITNLSKLEQISKMQNVELYILSITRMNNGLEEKNKWLDEYAPYLQEDVTYVEK